MRKDAQSVQEELWTSPTGAILCILDSSRGLPSRPPPATRPWLCLLFPLLPSFPKSPQLSRSAPAALTSPGPQHGWDVCTQAWDLLQLWLLSLLT